MHMVTQKSRNAKNHPDAQYSNKYKERPLHMHKNVRIYIQYTHTCLCARVRVGGWGET